ncbi:TerD family protein [Streptomyces sp. HNM0663]|uniref:TerD family protein n=1 Tax=Streptomyces chengmaiensis TaxID=3040919 RepID=A0ABT6HR74_9ACTN|nr:TerD family protein [Streptomyces chengmaiensis]MDH2391215.1 TerD family protein [Streptomyces chengmaiensis]
MWLEASLTAVEEQIVRVLVVRSTESGAMRDAYGLSVAAFAPDGTSVARYDLDDAGGETDGARGAYRRAGGWKFRAVGQGYVNGLVGLVTDHGVDVAQEGQALPPAVPFQPPAPTVAPPPFQAPVPGVPFQLPVPGAPAPAAAGTEEWSFGAVFERTRPEEASHSRAVPSLLAVAKVRPSGPNAP